MDILKLVNIQNLCLTDNSILSNFIIIIIFLIGAVVFRMNEKHIDQEKIEKRKQVVFDILDNTKIENESFFLVEQ